ncbi:Hypothetical predicted protein [Podarcis lilfordi]|uniref:Uncharacterized protein n=1 Tax=Podarcis lilfordi TaxID=74358 RepID=A0AA35JZ52_9SAUR|nr:Hypothetical predicted protein [Podarcis lilfordi]
MTVLSLRQRDVLLNRERAAPSTYCQEVLAAVSQQSLFKTVFLIRQSFFPANMKPRLAQDWLLGVCLLLCLSCGGNNEFGDLEAQEGTRHVNKEACLTAGTFLPPFLPPSLPPSLPSFLLLTANALICSLCSSEAEGQPCVPAAPYEEKCADDPRTGHPAACVLYRITSMVTKNVLRYYKKCGFYTSDCKTRKVYNDVQQVHELHCCNNRDHCL